MRTEDQKAYGRRYTLKWRKANPEKAKAIKRRFNLKNRGKYREVEKAWRKRNPAKSRRYAQTQNLKLYGLSIGQYNDMFKKQNGKCALCRRPQTAFKRRFSVDHDHVTNAVRALLCTGCNTGLGGFRDDPDVLRKAAAYIEGEHRGNTKQG